MNSVPVLHSDWRLHCTDTSLIKPIWSESWNQHSKMRSFIFSLFFLYLKNFFVFLNYCRNPFFLVAKLFANYRKISQETLKTSSCHYLIAYASVLFGCICYAVVGKLPFCRPVWKETNKKQFMEQFEHYH